MQRLINEIVERAKANRQRIVLPEGTEERTLKAANQILTDGVADLILLGNPAEIEACRLHRTHRTRRCRTRPESGPAQLLDQRFRPISVFPKSGTKTK